MQLNWPRALTATRSQPGSRARGAPAKGAQLGTTLPAQLGYSLGASPALPSACRNRGRRLISPLYRASLVKLMSYWKPELRLKHGWKSSARANPLTQLYMWAGVLPTGSRSQALLMRCYMRWGCNINNNWHSLKSIRVLPLCFWKNKTSPPLTFGFW